MIIQIEHLGFNLLGSSAVMQKLWPTTSKKQPIMGPTNQIIECEAALYMLTLVQSCRLGALLLGVSLFLCVNLMQLQGINYRRKPD